MRAANLILLLVLIALLAIGVGFFFYYMPIGKLIEYKTFKAQASPEMLANLTSESSQFYPNMRYKDNNIGYAISDSCDSKRKNNAEDAFLILSQRTILTFYENKQNPEINVLCSNIAPTPDEAGHFIAGEGGPSEIINATVFSVILSGKVSLYRVDNCQEPKVAIHEILHALGFNHNSNESSIMYPITECNQEIDSSIIEDIDILYSAPSLPDLAIEEIEANRTGRYINFQAIVSNIGLQDSRNSSLIVYAGNEKIAEYSLDDIEIGKKKILTVENVFASGDSSSLKFSVQTNENEISKDNNAAEINAGQD